MAKTGLLNDQMCDVPQFKRQSFRVNSSPIQRRADAGRLRRASWSFSTRRVPHGAASSTLSGTGAPIAGDLVLARVDTIGHHDGLQLANGRRKQLFVGDEIVVAYGNRYACSQFEALVPDTLGPCHLVAGGGIAGRAISWHERIVKGPTHITPLGVLTDADGRRMNLRDYAIERIANVNEISPTVLAVVGTTMDVGKTQTAAYLVRGLIGAGLRVGYAKVTGTGAGGDTWLLKDAGADPVLDFTDAGLASTYLAPPEKIDEVLVTLTAHIAQEGVDTIVVEVADGIFQRETAALLRSPVFSRVVSGTVLAARDAMGASAGVNWLRAQSSPVLAVSGLLSASPLQSAEVKLATGLTVYNREALADASTGLALIGAARRTSHDNVRPQHANDANAKSMVRTLPSQRVLRRCLQSDPKQEYLVYVPGSGASEAPILVAVHGLACNPDDLAGAFCARCEEAGVVWVAPLFTTEQHADYQRLGRVGRGARADVILDRCVAELASLTGADARRLYLFGYSAGAQFVHRYLMAHPHAVAAAVPASAGWYTFPDTQVRFPYGVRPHRSLPGVSFDPEAFLRVPVTVLVGQDDVGDDSLRSTERINRQQGVNRVERARRWVKAMRASAAAYGYEPRISCIEVPGIDHSFAKFCERGALAERVFAALFGQRQAELAAGSAPTRAAT